jgi:hypothetical protein
MNDASGFSMNDEPPPETPEETITRLAGLPELEYGLVRIEEAKRIGVPVGAIELRIKADDSRHAPTGMRGPCGNNFPSTQGRFGHQPHESARRPWLDVVRRARGANFRLSHYPRASSLAGLHKAHSR